MSALSKHRADCEKVELVLWAGDMVEKGNVAALKPVIEVTKKFCGKARIIAVFGNEEYMDREREFITRYPEIVWLNDNHYVYVSSGGEEIAIYGTRGSLDRPTRWQRRHIPGIEKVYRERAIRLKEEVLRLKKEYEKVVVLMHYAPTYLTLEGEDKSIWPEMGSIFMEKAIRESKPNIVIHGHAHNSKRLEVTIDNILIVNVAFPARKDVTILTI
ncbi:metallophosphoesterase [Pyrofollis japonicus]|nr:metallophosphoesterase [Pyrofollis japonicus]